MPYYKMKLRRYTEYEIILSADDVRHAEAKVLGGPFEKVKDKESVLSVRDVTRTNYDLNSVEITPDEAFKGLYND